MKDILLYFGKSQAASYDERSVRMTPLREALYFLISNVLADLPQNARILCVGAGTGSELIELARRFPHWTFMATDPSGPMLEVCRKKIAEAGLNSRCEFHEGFLNSLPMAEPYDAATAILVSQFLLDPKERKDFFSDIAQRLKKGSYLINADLSSPFPLISSVVADLFEVWLRAQGLPSDSATAVSSWGKNVAVSSTEEITRVIESAGFHSPVLFFQALFIHAWYVRL